MFVIDSHGEKGGGLGGKGGPTRSRVLALVTFLFLCFRPSKEILISAESFLLLMSFLNS